jgi:hypothetical protein
MAFAPDFASAQHFRLRAYALERQSVVYGWARSHGVPIPGIKLIPHGALCRFTAPCVGSRSQACK